MAGKVLWHGDEVLGRLHRQALQLIRQGLARYPDLDPEAAPEEESGFVRA